MLRRLASQIKYIHEFINFSPQIWQRKTVEFRRTLAEAVPLAPRTTRPRRL